MPNSETEFTLKDGVLKFIGAAEPIFWWVSGRPITSTTKHRRKLRRWKEDVACAVKANRGDQWCSKNSKHLYAVTLQFRFCQRSHPSHEGDLDNYVKPVLDGLAAGLFLEEKKDPRDRHHLPTFAVHHGVDDSNFRILLIRRLDVKAEEEEGVCIFISSTGKVPEVTRATHQICKEAPR